MAADESSLLIADGPNHLAECLFLCAKAPRDSAITIRLGMNGGGFRSVLGQRIARLLQARGHVGRPLRWYWRLTIPLLSVGVLWMGMSALNRNSPASSERIRKFVCGSGSCFYRFSVAPGGEINR